MSIKFLGTLIDENYFTKFMAKSYWPCFRQVSKNVRLLFETSVHLNKKCLTQIYFSLVHSYRNYSNIAWARTTSTKLNEILLKQNHVAPIILNIDRQSNARPLLFFFFFFFFLFIILRRYRFLIYKFTNSTMNINSYTN